MHKETASSSEKESRLEENDLIRTESGSGVGGIVPHMIRRNTVQQQISFMFRPKDRCRDVEIAVSAQGAELYSRRYVALSPGEMCKVTVDSAKLMQAGDTLKIEVREATEK